MAPGCTPTCNRVEGDLTNAGYWYRRAGRPASQQPLPDEWTAIVETLLGGLD